MNIKTIASAVLAAVVLCAAPAFADGKMNLSLKAVGGGILVASQFTLAADTNSGTRPSFSPAADPALGRPFMSVFSRSSGPSALTR